MFMHESMAHFRASLNSYQVHTILNGDLADSIICECSDASSRSRALNLEQYEPKCVCHIKYQHAWPDGNLV